jgi:MYXO-CTERM domain-containing protein
MRRFFVLAGPLFALLSACAPQDPAEPVSGSRAALAIASDEYYLVLDGPSAAARIPRGADARSPEVAAATRLRVAEIDAEQDALVPAIERVGGEVVARLSRVANAIQVRALREDVPRLERLPGVRRVEPVPRFRRSLASAVPVIGAPAVWTRDTPLLGEGVTIGIIDSGIDYVHADFGGPGTPEAYAANDGAIAEPGTFPTAKVVGGWDFVGDAYDNDQNSQPKPDPDPLDCIQPDTSVGHGTHVAGIAAGMGVTAAGEPFAGPYAASLDPAAFLVSPGVAPGASLYALRVFGCVGSTSMLGPALDRAADPDQDGSMADRLDVVNLSLGTSYALGSPLTGEMIHDLTSAGTLVVAAAGNDGQAFFTTGSPGTYPEVLSVAASADNALLTLAVTAPLDAAAEYPAAEGAFTAPLRYHGPITAELAVAAPIDGCAALANASEVAGKVALIHRGSCLFLDKLNNALAAGAAAAVIVDDEGNALPFPMDAAEGSAVALPGFMVTGVHGAALEAAVARGPVTVTLDPLDRFDGLGAELLADFSSRGPSPVDSRMKPEIAAPGASIDSAGVGAGTGPRRLDGTSMASPMVAGAAALVREAQPALGPLDVKAALVNTAHAIASLEGDRYGTSAVGSGRAAVDRAVSARVTASADPERGDVGVAFGPLLAVAPTTFTRSIDVTNHDGLEHTFSLSIEPTFELPGTSVTVTPGELVVPAGATAQLQVSLTVDPALLGAPGPDPNTSPTQGQQTPLPRHYLNEANGVVRLAAEDGGADVVVPYNGSVRAAARRKGVPPSACASRGASPDDPVAVALEGDGAHPAPVVTAFQLAALDDADPKSAEDSTVALTDVRAVGVATNLATAASFDEAMVYFGVALEGQWTTPARGPLSVVAIEIDTKGGPKPEYAIRLEPRNPEDHYRDSLAAATYDLSTGERINRFPINIVGPDVALTHPFYSSVVVLSALFKEIGVEEDDLRFDYAVVTENPELLVQGDRVRASFDASEVILDPARAGLDGAPLYVGAGPVLVDVAPEARASGAPLDLLLLHHTNEREARYEVVSLVPPPIGNLGLLAAAPARVAGNETASVSMTVTNGEAYAPGARLVGTLVGGTLEQLTASERPCGAGPAIDCALGDLAPGATVTVTATVRPSASAASMSLAARIESELECETATEDNEAKVLVTIAAVDLPPEPAVDRGAPLDIGGGCACRVGEPAQAPRPGAWMVVGAAGLAALRRRRRLGARAPS